MSDTGEMDLGLPPVEEEGESYVGLARKYRPQTFKDMTGQEAVARALTKAIGDDRVPHALLFAGPRGTGKTSSARILAKALNCDQGPTAEPCGMCRHCEGITNGSDMDVIEIDGASNTGVDNIRELRERVNYTAFSAKWKVYIIDEVHMLSQGAFNALLKTLEEPPPRVIFIFATTEPDRVPQTIRSRCAVYNFRRINSRDIAARLAHVVEHEKDIRLADSDTEALLLAIAESAEGGMRDALVTLDQLVSLCEDAITVDDARQLLGLVEQGLLSDIVEGLTRNETAALLKRVDELASGGQDFEQLIKSLVRFTRDLLIVKTAGRESGLVDVAGDRLEALSRMSAEIPNERLLQFMRAFLDLEAEIRSSAQPRILFEFLVMKLTLIDPVEPIGSILERLGAIDPDATPTAGGAPTDGGAESAGAQGNARGASAAPAREKDQAQEADQAGGSESAATPSPPRKPDGETDSKGVVRDAAGVETPSAPVEKLEPTLSASDDWDGPLISGYDEEEDLDAPVDAGPPAEAASNRSRAWTSDIGSLEGEAFVEARKKAESSSAKIARLKRESPELAEAMEMVISQFSGKVTHVDGRPLRGN